MVLSEDEMRRKMMAGAGVGGVPQANPGGGGPPLRGGGPLADQPPYQAPPQGGALPSLSAPPNGQGGPNGATPASVGSQPQGGAGNPMELLDKANPEKVLSNAETAARAAAKTGATADPQADAQKKQLNESMMAQGMDPVKAYNELKDQFMDGLEKRHKSGEIDKKTYTGMKERWKNIFNIVPKEDFGLFLMDFGLRLAAHSQDSDFGSAVGQAGLGALGGVQERKRYDQEGALKRDELAHGRAMDVAGLAQTERRIGALSQAKERNVQTEHTEDGMIEYDPQTKQWKPVINPDTGKPYKKDYASSGGYQGEKFWMKNQLANSNLSEDEINNLLLGARTPQERSQVLQDTLGKLKGDFAARDANRKPYREYGPEDDAKWIAGMMRAADDAVDRYREEKAVGRHR